MLHGTYKTRNGFVQWTFRHVSLSRCTRNFSYWSGWMTGIDCVLACPLPFWHVSCCLASPSFGLSLAILAFCFGPSIVILACPMLFWPVLCHFGPVLVLACLLLFWPYVFMVFLHRYVLSCCEFIVFLPCCVLNWPSLKPKTTVWNQFVR